MTGQSVRLPYPWAAVVDLSRPEPARFYASLIGQAVRYGRPAARRGGRLRGVVARGGVPERWLAGGLVAARRAGRDHPGMTAELAALAVAWPGLRERDDTLPVDPPVSALRLDRSSAVTTFYFGQGLPPLVVGKRPLGDDASLRNEVQALQRVASLRVGPLLLGEVPGVGVLQRGLEGRSLRVQPVTPSAAGRVRWTRAHEDLTRLLERLAAATASPASPAALTDDVVGAALRWDAVPDDLRRAVDDAQQALRARAASVLQHTDTSPQNVLVQGGSVRGLVDWEMAHADGLPGADAWNAGLSYLEHGYGLVGWGEPDLLQVFRGTWGRSGFGRAWRDAGRRCALAAGVDADLLDAHELVWAARRTGFRLLEPDDYPTSAALSLQQLLHVHAVQRSTALPVRPPGAAAR